MTERHNWLAEFVQTGSDTAFGQVVSNYVDLVYSTALRLVDGDTHRAEDVAQMVFVNLARVARKLPEDVKLGGWLHRDTCFTASTVMRGERRRRTREREAVEMNVLQNHPEPDYSQVAPILDEAINELEEVDRTAIVLRFYEHQDFRAVGQALGNNEDAARMRVNRALEKLEVFLKRRGVTTTAASLGAVLTANAIQAAPGGLAAAISSASVLTKTAVVATATKAITMTTLQKTLIAAAVTFLAAAGGWEALRVSRLREQNQKLQHQQVPLAEQIEQLQREKVEAANRLSSLADEIQRIRGNSAELLKLRGEVGRLRQQAASNPSPAQAMAAVMKDSSAVGLARVQIRQALKTRYAPLVEALQLSPETTDNVFNLITENEVKKKIICAQLVSGDMDVDTALRERDKGTAETERQIADVLGDSGYVKYDQFNHDTAASDLVKGLNKALGALALNEEQSIRLQSLFAAKPDIIIDDVDLFRSKESFDALFQTHIDRGHHDLQEAASFLTPEQLASAYTIQSNYFDALKNQVALGQQLVKKVSASRQ
jgi:RNA polymerase sigma factor (sigma-70 family)